MASRLGSGPTGAEEVKRSSFFSTLDFARVLAREYSPEFVPPTASSATDAINFDKEFTEEAPADSMVTTHMTGTMQEKSNFEGFTFQGEEQRIA